MKQGHLVIEGKENKTKADSVFCSREESTGNKHIKHLKNQFQYFTIRNY